MTIYTFDDLSFWQFVFFPKKLWQKIAPIFCLHVNFLKTQLSASIILPNPSIDIGSRFGVDSYNSRALLLYPNEILRTLRNASQLNKLASELLEIMLSDQAGLINLECSILSLIYFTVLGPFHSVISKNTLPFSEAINFY